MQGRDETIERATVVDQTRMPFKKSSDVIDGRVDSRKTTIKRLAVAVVIDAEKSMVEESAIHVLEGNANRETRDGTKIRADGFPHRKGASTINNVQSIGILDMVLIPPGRQNLTRVR